MKTATNTTVGCMFLLGAGASVESGVPTANEFTALFSEFSRNLADEHAVTVENVFRQIQLSVAEAEGIAASRVDFESVIGALTDVATGRWPHWVVSGGGGTAGTVDTEKTRDAVARLLSITKELLDTAPERTSYLSGMLGLRQFGRPLNIFTLNFDRTVEQMLLARRVRFADGFRRLKTPTGLAIWDPSAFEAAGKSIRLFKLHGSLDWAVLQSGPRPTSNAHYGVTQDYLRAYPRLVRLQDWRSAHLSLPGAPDGPAMAINVGTRKELMYTATPFAFLFHRFADALSRASVCVIAGYSFRDERVNRMLEEALVERRGALRLVVVDPNVYSLADQMPTLWEFGNRGIATLLQSTFGRSLSSGELLTATRKGIRAAQADGPMNDWGDRIVSPNPLPSRGRDPAVIEVWWRRVRTYLDGLAVREKRLAAAMDDRNPTSRDGIGLTVELVALVALAKGAFVALDAVMECMDFGPYFGAARVDKIVDRPRKITNVASEPDVAHAMGELSRWISVAFLKYHYTSGEFLHGISDPTYGSAIHSPDNFSMAELVARETREGLDEVAYALNAMFAALGCESPFPG